MTNHDDQIQYWGAILDILENAENTLPYGEEPDIAVWSNHPDEEWKNRAQRDELESNFYGPTEEFILRFCDKGKWPGRFKRAVPFYARKRINWARNLVRILLTPYSNEISLVLPAPTISAGGFVYWLLVTAYDHRNPPEPKRDLFLMSGPLAPIPGDESTKK